MLKSGALARQTPDNRKNTCLNKVIFDFFIWLATSLIGSFFGFLIEHTLYNPLRAFFYENGLNAITGPKIYFDYFWIYYLIFKVFSLLSVYSKFGTIALIKEKSIKDIFSILLYTLEYQFVNYILHEFEFKISGHCLLLTIGTYAYYTEGEILASLDTKYLSALTKILVIFHHYCLFFTCMVYHTLPESLAGLLLGLATIKLLNFAFPS